MEEKDADTLNPLFSVFSADESSIFSTSNCRIFHFFQKRDFWAYCSYKLCTVEKGETGGRGLLACTFCSLILVAEDEEADIYFVESRSY